MKTKEQYIKELQKRMNAEAGYFDTDDNDDEILTRAEVEAIMKKGNQNNNINVNYE